MEDDKNTKLDQQLDRNITLESLLDAPPSKNACKRKISDSNNYVIHPVPPNKRPRGQMTQAKEASLELIAILLQQDVNGFFHFTPKKVCFCYVLVEQTIILVALFTLASLTFIRSMMVS